MGRIPGPTSQRASTVNIASFKGADLTSAPSYVSIFRSPDCENMIRESSGKIRKWIGFHTVKNYTGKINGFHIFTDESGDRLLVHAGTTLYYGDAVVATGMSDERSVSRQLNKKLVIADGKSLILYYKEADKYVAKAAQSEAYVPTIVISRKPSGGGTTYEAVNLITAKRKDSFLATQSDTVYQLSAAQIAEVNKVEKLNASGGYDNITGYTVDLVSGKVTFSTAPGASVVTGQDNLIITYSKTVEGYAEKINGCDIMTLYGVNGARDRIFLAGDDKCPNRDYYCQMDDPTYWGDLWYSVVGQDNSKIMGYSIINDKLATHLDRSDDDTNIILRTGSLSDSAEARFTLSGSYQGSGAICKNSFATLETEPLFLTKDGIMAVTPSDVLGERYAQLRSYYINGLLLKQSLPQAVCTTFDRFYMLCVGGYLFALDGTQASAQANEPYSVRQYECFYRTNINARCMTVIAGKLLFGTAEGKICEFFADYSNANNFNDDGKPIAAKWTTPEIFGKNFYNKKRFKLISAMIGSATATGVKISAFYDGTKETLVEYDTTARYFSFSNVCFSKLTFKIDKTSQIFKEKISVKPDNKKAQFIFENDILNEPLALYNASIEFTESR